MAVDDRSRDHIAQNIETYDAIAEHYDAVTGTLQIRAWKEMSMRRFAGHLSGTRVLVPGCGEGRDSRYLRSLNLEPLSFVDCIATCRRLLASGGILYVSMKEGEGERYEEPTLGSRYPGGDAARTLLRGVRFYAYYRREEILDALAGFDVLHEQRMEPGEGSFEFWLRKSDAYGPAATPAK